MQSRSTPSRRPRRSRPRTRSRRRQCQARKTRRWHAGDSVVRCGHPQSSGEPAPSGFSRVWLWAAQQFKSWKRVLEVSELGPQSRPQVQRCTASFSARLLLVSAALFGAVAMALWPRERVSPLAPLICPFLLVLFRSMRQALRPLSLGGAYPLSALSPHGWEFSLRWPPFPHIHTF